MFKGFLKWFRDKKLVETEYDERINFKYCVSEMLELVKKKDPEKPKYHEELAEKLFNEYSDKKINQNDLDELISALDCNLDNVIYSINNIDRILYHNFGIKSEEDSNEFIEKLFLIVLTSALSKNGGNDNPDKKFEKGPGYIPPEEGMKRLLEPFFNLNQKSKKEGE